MKRRMLLILFLVLLSFNFGFATAVNSQGFEWGPEVDDRIDYRAVYSQPSVPSDPSGLFDFYVLIVSLTTIPDPVTDFTQVATSAGAEFYYANGTQFYAVPWIIVAVGNWSLLTQLYFALGYTEDDNVTETANEWVVKSQVTYGGGWQYTETRISKTDGAINLRGQLTISGDYEIISSYSIIRLGYTTTPTNTGSGRLDLFLYLIGVGAVVAVAIVYVLNKRMRMS
jgi:hypothetical protein